MRTSVKGNKNLKGSSILTYEKEGCRYWKNLLKSCFESKQQEWTADLSDFALVFKILLTNLPKKLTKFQSIPRDQTVTEAITAFESVHIRL